MPVKTFIKAAGVLFAAALLASIFACSNKADEKNQAHKPVEGKMSIKMPDGSVYEVNNDALARKYGIKKENIEKNEKRQAKVLKSYFIDRASVPAEFLPSTLYKIIAVDVLFSSSGSPMDPDQSLIKDANGQTPLGRLLGRVNLDPDTGEALSNTQPDAMPDYFRQLLAFAVAAEFKEGLLYVEGQPRGKVAPGGAPTPLPDLNAMSRPIPPPKKEVPETMPDIAGDGKKRGHGHEDKHEHGGVLEEHQHGAGGEDMKSEMLEKFQKMLEDRKKYIDKQKALEKK